MKPRLDKRRNRTSGGWQPQEGERSCAHRLLARGTSTLFRSNCPRAARVPVSGAHRAPLGRAARTRNSDAPLGCSAGALLGHCEGATKAPLKPQRRSSAARAAWRGALGGAPWTHIAPPSELQATPTPHRMGVHVLAKRATRHPSQTWGTPRVMHKPGESSAESARALLCSARHFWRTAYMTSASLAAARYGSSTPEGV